MTHFALEHDPHNNLYMNSLFKDYLYMKSTNGIRAEAPLFSLRKPSQSKWCASKYSWTPTPCTRKPLHILVYTFSLHGQFCCSQVHQSMGFLWSFHALGWKCLVHFQQVERNVMKKSWSRKWLIVSVIYMYLQRLHPIGLI